VPKSAVHHVGYPGCGVRSTVSFLRPELRSRFRLPGWRTIVVASTCLALAAVAATASAARLRSVRLFATGPTLPLRTAIFDSALYGGTNAPTAFALTSSAGATYVRLIVRWNAVAPATPPPDFVATDPTSPGYSWTHLDASVAAAEAAGLTPILNVGAPPSWAYANPPKNRNGGTPQVGALGQFATALATHYNGSEAGLVVHDFMLWDEPNLSLHLDPVSPAIYRNMVNAFAASIHAVDPTSLIVAGALDPFGHKKTRKQDWYSAPPLTYMRSLLCISAGAHPHSTCKKPVHFDVWAHHPYTFGGPFAHARKSGDVSLGDLPKMRALLRQAAKLHHIVSTHPVQFWVTEFGWDSKPPRPHAVPLKLEGRWTSEALFQMWRSGVSLVTWFLLQDQASPSPYQSGIYFHSPSIDTARAKPMRTSFRFPFVAFLGKGKVSVWGRDATSDKQLLTIKRRHGGHGAWRTVARIRSNSYGIFRATLKLKATKKDWLLATAPGSGKSIPFSLTEPKPCRCGPWGN
jgi:Cellulase (glycosyl hydrolase family 5)